MNYNNLHARAFVSTVVIVLILALLGFGVYLSVQNSLKGNPNEEVSEDKVTVTDGVQTNNTETLDHKELDETGEKETLMKAEEWLTYRNEEYGYEFQYPSSWSVLYEDDTFFSVGITPYTDPAPFTDGVLKIGFSYEDFNDYAENYMEYASLDYERDKCTETIFSGLKATSCVPWATMAGHTTIFIDKVDGRDAFTVYYDDMTHDPELTSEVNEILSTFKFI